MQADHTNIYAQNIQLMATPTRVYNEKPETGIIKKQEE